MAADETSDEENDTTETAAQQNDFDELQAIGFALASSAALLPGLSTTVGTRNCLDVALNKTMDGVCTTSDREALDSAPWISSLNKSPSNRNQVLQSTVAVAQRPDEPDLSKQLLKFNLSGN